MSSNDGAIVLGFLAVGIALAWGAKANERVSALEKNAKRSIENDPKEQAIQFDGPYAEIKRSVFQKYTAEQYSDAVLEASKWLFDLIREKSGVTDKDTTKLINHVFGKEALLKFHLYPEHPHIQNAGEGLVHMLRGVAQAFRNPLAHGRIQLSKEEATNQLHIIGYLGQKIELLEVPIDVPILGETNS